MHICTKISKVDINALHGCWQRAKLTVKKFKAGGGERERVMK